MQGQQQHLSTCDNATAATAVVSTTRNTPNTPMSKTQALKSQ
jgi:hypothetical protein